MYGPLDFGAPFLLRGTQILQRLFKKNLKWDTKLPEYLQNECEKWKMKPPFLAEVQIKRCFKQRDFEKTFECNLYHFSAISGLLMRGEKFIAA